MDSVLIIGQGIAGSVLSLSLHIAGIPFVVVDDGHKTSSSIVAAGLYNAMAYKRGNLAWRAHELFDGCETFYQKWEKEFKVKFLHRDGLHRRIHYAEEYNNWTARMADKNLAPFIDKLVSSDLFSDSFDLPQGLCKVRGGWLDVPLFLETTKDFLTERASYLEAKIDLSKLESREGKWNWNGRLFSKVILCTGYRSAYDDRFFSGLPFSLAKGHTLILKVPGAELDEVINANVFVIPLGDDLYRIGSTFSWVNLNEEVEEKEVEKLEKEFQRLCSLPYEIIEKMAGVRPTVQDQKPLIGESKENRGVWHFGGFGSRAVLYCPVLAESFIERLEKRSPEDTETSVDRKRL
jgi:glycine oxidase